ncbi:MAG: hypothetical protein U0237_20015 [Thermoleophilia bacterium]
MTTRRVLARSAVLTATLAVLAVPATGSAAVRWFHSPTGNLSCEVADHDTRGSYAYCQSERTPVSAKLAPNGTVRICTGTGCLGNGPEDAITLRYGRSVTVGRYRCTSRADGIRCRVRASGRGFLINASGVTRLR